MRPVDAQFPVSQEFGSFATAGVVGDPNGSEVQQLVAEYGNYQPFGHAGCDIACPVGTPIHAIADGTVLWADWGTNLPGDDSDAGYRQRWYLYKTFPGIVTLIQHDGWIGIYAHMSEAPLNPGDVVTEGQQIGLSGNTRSPGVSLGAHLHVGALVDLNYPSGNGLIYGCTDPEPYFGGIAAMGSITPLEDTLSAAEVDAIVAEANKQSIETRRVILEALGLVPGKVLNQPVPYKDPATGKDTGQTTNLATLAGFSDFQHTASRAGIPAAVLNQQFKLADGTVTNLAGILTAINAKPVSGAAAGPVSTDVQAVANAVVATLSKQLGK